MIGDVSSEYLFLCLRCTPWVRSCSSQNPCDSNQGQWTFEQEFLVSQSCKKRSSCNISIHEVSIQLINTDDYLFIYILYYIYIIIYTWNLLVLCFDHKTFFPQVYWIIIEQRPSMQNTPLWQIWEIQQMYKISSPFFIPSLPRHSIAVSTSSESVSTSAPA